jgi:hypothetical protein
VEVLTQALARAQAIEQALKALSVDVEKFFKKEIRSGKPSA